MFLGASPDPTWRGPCEYQTSDFDRVRKFNAVSRRIRFQISSNLFGVCFTVRTGIDPRNRNRHAVLSRHRCAHQPNAKQPTSADERSHFDCIDSSWLVGQVYQVFAKVDFTNRVATRTHFETSRPLDPQGPYAVDTPP